VRIPIDVLLLDLLVYLLHRAYHVVPFLWRLHLVHHTDLDLDVSSASRFHAGEVLVSSLVKLAAVAFLGISPAGLVTFEALMLFCAQLQHANIRVPRRVEDVLWGTFVPPAMHRIHHTPTAADTNSNFGTILTLWDRLLGTLRRRPATAPPAFGVSEERDEKDLGRLFVLLLLPFRTGRPASEGVAR
jgi:sterol desaturase/sphingolipid hydroxylase (fatty acid hydroxylase superfamily)